MRLINVDTLKLEEFFGDYVPKYAILSHRWSDDEVAYKDFVKDRRQGAYGYEKVTKFCEQVRTRSDGQYAYFGNKGVKHAWVDTVCINKSSSAELSEAINSMWSYYKKAEVCYVLLPDVELTDSVEFAREDCLLEHFNLLMHKRRNSYAPAYGRAARAVSSEPVQESESELPDYEDTWEDDEEPEYLSVTRKSKAASLPLQDQDLPNDDSDETRGDTGQIADRQAISSDRDGLTQPEESSASIGVVKDTEVSEYMAGKPESKDGVDIIETPEESEHDDDTMQEQRRIKRMQAIEEELYRQEQDEVDKEKGDKFQNDLLRSVESSAWFSRGWTLQELLAPSRLLILTNRWDVIGRIDRTSANRVGRTPDFASQKALTAAIATASGIAIEVVKGVRDHQQATIAEKMSWLVHRVTTREEDMAYCSLGLFGVHMPLLYGEGKNAFRRLQEEIIRRSNDESIFAWPMYHCQWGRDSLLATSPSQFRGCTHLRRTFQQKKLMLYSVTNQGLELRLQRHSASFLVPKTSSLYAARSRVLVPLNCADPSGHAFVVGLVKQECGHYDRKDGDQAVMRRMLADNVSLLEEDKTIYVHTPSLRQACQQIYGEGYGDAFEFGHSHEG